MTPLRIRPAMPADAPAMAGRLAVHVRAGGRTAIAAPPGPAALPALWLTRPRALPGRLAVDALGLLGLPAVARHPRLPPGRGDVGTVMREGRARRDVGRGLIAAMRAEAAACGLAGLVAAVRAETAAGLGCPCAMGVSPWLGPGDGGEAARLRPGP